MGNKINIFGGIEIAPLSGGFMLIGLLAFFSAILFIGPAFNNDWAFIIGFIGALMFFASMISMTKAPVPEELLIDEHLSNRESRVKVMSKRHYKAYVKAQKAQAKAKKTTKKKVAKKKVVKKVAKTRSKAKVGSKTKSSRELNKVKPSSAVSKKSKQKVAKKKAKK